MWAWRLLTIVLKLINIEMSSLTIKEEATKMQTQEDKGNFSSHFEGTTALMVYFGNLAVRVAVILCITALIFYGAVLKFETSTYADQPNNTPVPVSTDIIDANPSDHPSGKDRNVEPGNSGTQGKSESNPDKDGVDKPYPADGQEARSQGRNDNDGNNGCGNDNDFSDDNNGNCGGKKKETPTASPTPQESPTPKTTATPSGETPTPTPTPTPLEGTPTPTPPPGATPTTQLGDVIPFTVAPKTEKIFQPQPTPIPSTSIPAGEPPKVLPKAGEIPFTPVWLAIIGISLVIVGSRLKKWGLRK